MKETVFAKDGHMAQPLSPVKNIARHLKQRSKSIFPLLIKKLGEFVVFSSTEKHSNEFKHKIYNLDIKDITKGEIFNNKKIKMIYDFLCHQYFGY